MARKIIVAALLALGVYVSSYVLLVTPKHLVFYGGVGPWSLEADFRIGGDLAKLAYRPLEVIDRKLRPDIWTFDFDRNVIPPAVVDRR